MFFRYPLKRLFHDYQVFLLYFAMETFCNVCLFIKGISKATYIQLFNVTFLSSPVTAGMGPFLLSATLGYGLLPATKEVCNKHLLNECVMLSRVGDYQRHGSRALKQTEPML